MINIFLLSIFEFPYVFPYYNKTNHFRIFPHYVTNLYSNIYKENLIN